MNRNEFLKNLGFGTVALIAGESLLSSCMGVMDMGESVAPIVSDGEFINALRISETISGTGPLIAQSVQDELFVGKKVGVQSYRDGILGPTFRVQKGSIVNIAFQNKMAEHSNVH